MDLMIFYSPEKACITYYSNIDSAGYKIELPFAYIKDITLESGEPGPNIDNNPPRPGGLVIELNRSPNFFMDSSGGFYQCEDFTEDQQASQVLVHHLGGYPEVLRNQLGKLVSLESFQNRHSPYDVHAVPTTTRMSQENNSRMSSYLPQTGSVQLPIAYSMLHSPIPSFQQFTPHFTPDQKNLLHLPQYPMQGGPLGPNLQVDTSPGNNIDDRWVPMLATPSGPSEYACPRFFGPVPTSTPMASADFITAFSSTIEADHDNVGQPIEPCQPDIADPCAAPKKYAFVTVTSPRNFNNPAARTLIHQHASKEVWQAKIDSATAHMNDTCQFHKRASKLAVLGTPPNGISNDLEAFAVHKVDESHRSSVGASGLDLPYEDEEDAPGEQDDNITEVTY
jgi:hypothetical protein